MQPQKRWPCHLIVLLLWVTPGWVQGQAAGTEQLGQVHFRVACSADVQQEFDRGVALLHSFALTLRPKPLPPWRSKTQAVAWRTGGSP